jgi:hypothetical protein
MELNLPWKIEKADTFMWGVRDKDGVPVCAFADLGIADYVINLVNSQGNFDQHDV